MKFFKRCFEIARKSLLHFPTKCHWQQTVVLWTAIFINFRSWTRLQDEHFLYLDVVLVLVAYVKKTELAVPMTGKFNDMKNLKKWWKGPLLNATQTVCNPQCNHFIQSLFIKWIDFTLALANYFFWKIPLALIPHRITSRSIIHGTLQFLFNQKIYFVRQERYKH